MKNGCMLKFMCGLFGTGTVRSIERNILIKICTVNSSHSQSLWNAAGNEFNTENYLNFLNSTEK